MPKTKKPEIEAPVKQEGGAAKLQAIKLAMDQIEKQYGKGSIMRLGERTPDQLKTEVISTGSIALDLSLGVGGLPRGRIIEIYGPEASGKTTLALSVVAEAQKRGGQCAFVDAEHALDPQRAEILGVDLDNLLMSQPDTGEQALEITETLIRSGAIDVVVVDSVAALVPRAELEGEMGDSVMGMQARLMSQALRKLTGAISKSKTVLIFTNQLRQKIGIMFGNPETTPGGLALKFYSSVRIDLRRIEVLKDGEKVIGSRHRARIVKNKVAPPLRVAEFDIMESEGISKTGGILDVGLELGLIGKSGSFFNYEGKPIAQGKEAAKMYLRDNPKVAEEIDKKIREVVASGKKLPKEIGEETEE
ncbi:MAG: RecA protein, recombination protein RecA [Microgenomates group bacterium GW2011_GWC1_41_20]|uniref:Protein RecA n=7 Tax=Candidatus Woeseibacteriota TaxID=1752722 RepID=A0A0G0S1V7_9BACT|nr:MAG: Protein RecA [Candidatus Woesebacteria bacterium GW2011_GWB1_40_12]KKR56221.1 MAG: Protein RecA [Candidatus Woesebacteria bacterium GW2011_GWF1_40_24]KKR90533.1 MAG: Protein RecA [Candidatus Woesebacteria bacterium GW2011_GWD1_41_12]KKS00800.1 MAG: RecA protein, recombination protein RecA [Microgenomates group bacterium GW2011_GWC1_41_20]KKS05761.1 MAG: Protein RecA [Candidatus Woesebacteria bacterium GW2011_GWE1_41_24]KKS18137.1 MAG: Protein RecA [Candidatus Woesebacteria bacterium GW